MAWLLDLDGVVWLAHRPIAGSVAAIDRLQDSGETVLFVTNFSALTQAQAEAKLADIGVDARGSVISSAMAAGSLIKPGERVMVCAGPGVLEAVEAAGGVFDDGREADVVVVGFHKEFDFEELATAAKALHAGARLIATNADPTYPTPDGLLPGNGALVAAVATAGKVEPVVAGKPYQPFADLIHGRLGTHTGDLTNRERHVVVGDLPSTDGLLASRLGFEFALVLTGVTSLEESETCEPRPDTVHPDLATLVADRLNSGQVIGPS